MLASDIPVVGRLFLKIFRERDGEAGAELVAYLSALAFESPIYDPASGSLVFVEPDGAITSAMVVVPIGLVACDKVVTGRLACAFMTDNAQSGGGAGAISLTLRAKNQDFAYADTASPTSLKHWRALGGQLVTLQSLSWTRTFRPAAGFVDRVLRRFVKGRGLALAAMAAPVDRLIKARLRTVTPPLRAGLHVEAMTDESFLDQAPTFVARYAIRPQWSRAELTWLLAMARRNETLGRLAIEAVKDETGRTIGCCVYYDAGARTAHVLNLLAARGRETDVLVAMFEAFDQRGYHQADGRAQPALMEGLALQAMVTFRHEAFVCICTRHADVVDAIRRGDIYVGGLAGEGWSRLMTDFW